MMRRLLSGWLLVCLLAILFLPVATGNYIANLNTRDAKLFSNLSVTQQASECANLPGLFEIQFMTGERDGRYVPPAPSANDHMNSTYRDPKPLRKHSNAPASPRFVSSPNCQDAPIRQFAHSMLLASIVGGTPSPLAPRILLIFKARTEKQMVWPYARRIVAVMADQLPYWDVAKMKNPGCAMGTYVSEASRIFHRPIVVSPTTLESTSPEPTRIRFLDLTPEPISKGVVFFGEGLIALLATEFSFRMPGGNELAPAF